MDIQEVVEAFARLVSAYYAAEAAFLADPTEQTLRVYRVAQNRYRVLNDELRHANLVADAMAGQQAAPTAPTAEPAPSDQP